MIMKTKALLITIGIVIGGATFMYALLTHTRTVIGAIMIVVGLLGTKVIYREILNYLQDQEKIKTGKWTNNKK